LSEKSARRLSTEPPNGQKSRKTKATNKPLLHLTAAASGKRQAASGKRQAASGKRQALAMTTHKNHSYFPIENFASRQTQTHFNDDFPENISINPLRS
jgi:hypothetical protein